MDSRFFWYYLCSSSFYLEAKVMSKIKEFIWFYKGWLLSIFISKLGQSISFAFSCLGLVKLYSRCIGEGMYISTSVEDFLFTPLWRFEEGETLRCFGSMYLIFLWGNMSVMLSFSRTAVNYLLYYEIELYFTPYLEEIGGE